MSPTIEPSQGVVHIRRPGGEWERIGLVLRLEVTPAETPPDDGERVITDASARTVEFTMRTARVGWLSWYLFTGGWQHPAAGRAHVAYRARTRRRNRRRR